MKHKFSKETIIDIFTDNIEQYKGETIESMYDDLFNKKTYIIGIYEATEALNDYESENSRYYGAFGAFDDINSYMDDSVGYYENGINDSVESMKNFYTNPEQVATVLAQCIADYFLLEILDETFFLNLDTTIDDKVIKNFTRAADIVKNSDNYFLKYN